MSDAPRKTANTKSPFDEAKERIDLAEYLTTHCGAYFLPDGAGTLKSICPWHNENTESLKIREANDGNWWIWSCHGACQEFNKTIIDAAMKQEELLTPMEALEYLNDLYSLDLDLNNPGYQEFKERVKKAKKEVDRVKGEMASDSQQARQARAYLRGRGLTDETIDFFELAVDTGHTRAGRIAIPIKEKGGHDVAVVTRALFDKYPCAVCKQDVSVAKDLMPRRSKWMRLTDRGEKPDYFWADCPHCGADAQDARLKWLTGQHPKYDNPPGYTKSEVLYNLPTARKALGADESLGYFVAEGYADVWATWQAGQKAASSYNGASLSDWQAGELTRHALRHDKPIILLPDIGDASGAGDTGLIKNLKVLRQQEVRPQIEIVYSYGDRDPDENGEITPINDVGELLELRGDAETARILSENRMPAAEFEIRGIVNATNPVTGLAANSQPRQMELVSEVLQHVEHVMAYEHLAAFLAEKWEISDPARVRTWMEQQMTLIEQMDNQSMLATTRDATAAFKEYAKKHDPIPLGYDQIDACLPGGGLGLKQIMLVLGKSGTGKSLQNGTFCLTATGYEKIENLRVGDMLIDPEGGQTQVTGVFPQGKRDAYKIVFNDKTEIVCDLEHLWKVKVNGKWHIHTTKQIIEAMECTKSRVYVPVMEPAQFTPQAKSLPIDPYIFGALLGDGCFTKHSIILTNIDDEIVQEVSKRLPQGMRMRQETNDDYRIVNGHNTGGKANAIQQALKDYDLWGHQSYFKYIPEEYLLASVEERLDLLRGLMDTDGYVSAQTRPKNGVDRTAVALEFVSASAQLSYGVARLVRSLGGVARPSIKKTSYKLPDGTRKRCADAHRVRISLPPDINPFLLSRKAERYSIRSRQPSRWIVSIEPLNKQVEMTCIKVDSTGELFVAGKDEYIVTHNTMWALQSLGNMARAKKVPSLFLSLEQPREQLIIRMLQQTLGIGREEAERVAASDGEPDEDPRLEEVHQLYENLVLYDGVPPEGQAMPRITPDRIHQIINEVNLTRVKDAIKIVAIDHLGILSAPVNDPTVPRSVQDSPGARAGWAVEKLFGIAKMTNTTILILQQLPKEVKSGVEFAKDAGYGGSEQTNFSDYVICIWRPEQDDTQSEERRAELVGQYKIKLAKNRHGAEIIAHYIWDKRTLRILRPKWSNASGLSQKEQDELHAAEMAVYEREQQEREDIPQPAKVSRPSVGAIAAAAGGPEPSLLDDEGTFGPDDAPDHDDIPFSDDEIGPEGLPKAKLDGDLTAQTREDPTPRDMKTLMGESPTDEDYNWYAE